MAGYSFKAWWVGTAVPATIAFTAGMILAGLVVLAILTVAVGVRLKTHLAGENRANQPRRPTHDRP